VTHYGTLLNLEKPALIRAERRLLASKTVPWTAFWPPVSSWLGAIQPVTTGINKVPTSADSAPPAISATTAKKGAGISSSVMATERVVDPKKIQAIAIATADIEKRFGAGSIMRYGSGTHPMNIGVIPTGSIALDLALGIGGVPRGRIVEIYGPESSGKTTLAQHIIAESQRLGGEVAYIDAEHALDPIYARACGVDVDAMLISQPDTGEQALEIADMLVRSGGVDVIVIDSVAALVPRAEIEGDMGDSHVGLQARLMSQALRKMTASISRSNCTVILSTSCARRSA